MLMGISEVRLHIAGPTTGVLARRAQRSIWSVDRLHIANTHRPSLCTEGFYTGLMSKVRISSECVEPSLI